MTRVARRLLLWSPRLLGVVVSVFLGMFALDVFGESRPLSETLVAFAIHVAPALVLLAAAVLSWRWEWVGGVVFLTLAILFTATTFRRMDWVLVIAGPLFLVGGLFLLSWRYRRELRAGS